MPTAAADTLSGKVDSDVGVVFAEREVEALDLPPEVGHRLGHRVARAVPPLLSTPLIPSAVYDAMIRYLAMCAPGGRLEVRRSLLPAGVAGNSLGAFGTGRRRLAAPTGFEPVSDLERVVS